MGLTGNMRHLSPWLFIVALGVPLGLGVGLGLGGLFLDTDSAPAEAEGTPATPAEPPLGVEMNVTLRNGPSYDSGPWFGTGVPYVLVQYDAPDGNLHQILQQATVTLRPGLLDVCKATMHYPSFFPIEPTEPDPTDTTVHYASESYSESLQENAPNGERCAGRFDRFTKATVTLCAKRDGFIDAPKDGVADTWDSCSDWEYEGSFPPEA